MSEPHESDAFRNADEFTVAVTYTVAGGTRAGTAQRRARKVAERLADTAARTAGVVAVTASAGPSRRGELIAGQPVRFAAANSGPGTVTEPHRLAGYLDPDHERALRSLRAANLAFNERRQTDRNRRQAAGCRNARLSLLDGPASCACVYCDPGTHLAALHSEREHGPSPFNATRCVCGTPVGLAAQRCATHTDVALVDLDGDAPELQALAAAQQYRQP